ncbi:hypothetical protein PIB30_055836 [Stylosanthes scabra]|uniref:Uncharacterized protein n=1 Tax=Stylosanthes scabra TaxID=79078 RepID=A0ABU6XH24_9FABA|nr:hypothetical protein [Stylosanthes scabra]
MRGKETAQIGMIESLIRELLQKMREEEGLRKKEKEKESKEKCQAKRTSYKKGEEKPQVDGLSVTGMFNEIEQILYRGKGADTHLVRNNSKWKKVYPPPSHFSRRLDALRARRAREEAGSANAAPQEDEVIDVSSDSDSEQVPEYVPGEGAGVVEEEVPKYVPGAEPMEEEEDPEKDPEEDPEEEPEEDPEEDPEEESEEDLEEDPEEEPQEEQPEAMEQEEEEEEGQEIAFDWANHEEGGGGEGIDLSNHDDFVDYWELAPPPSPANDEDDD